MARTRFLFGDPGSVEEVDPGEKEPKAFELTEGAWTQAHAGAKGPGPALRGMGAAKHGGDSRRPPRQLPSRQDVPHPSPRGQAVMVGSSNFTKRGLGEGGQPNLETNLASENRETVKELRAWFDRLGADHGRIRETRAEAHVYHASRSPSP